MKINTRIVLCSAALAALMLPAAAQNSSAPNPPATINQRKENQQDRIANGVASGQLTAGETANLEKKESNLNKEENLMRSEDNGKLTGADRKVLNQQQNQLSNKIYQDKHNAAVQNTNPKSEVGKRQENQRDDADGAVDLIFDHRHIDSALRGLAPARGSADPGNCA